ncbi:MAG: hypothetical protein FJX77_00030 [Armatimonadetes bacterium]|nr:hypothetical protein [Armatimonadota bacterium]
METQGRLTLLGLPVAPELTDEMLARLSLVEAPTQQYAPAFIRLGPYTDTVLVCTEALAQGLLTIVPTETPSGTSATALNGFAYFCTLYTVRRCRSPLQACQGRGWARRNGAAVCPLCRDQEALRSAAPAEEA